MNNIFESIGVYELSDLNGKRYLKRWENEALPLVLEFQYQLNEAEMTKDQVIDMFNRVEQTATASGSNRTAVGKAIDIVKLPSTLMDKLGELAGESKPVKGFDKLFDRGKSYLRGKLDNTVILSVIDGMGAFAKKHPIAQGFVIGLLTLASAAAVGPMAVPVVGAMLRFGNELLKGEKFSKATGRAIKTAALGLIATWGIKEVADMFINMQLSFKNIAGYEDIYKWTASYYKNGDLVFDINTYIPAELKPKISRLYDIAVEAANNGDCTRANEAFASLKRIIGSADWKNRMQEALANNQELYSNALASAEAARGTIDKVVSGVSAAIAGSTGGKEEVTEEDSNNTFKVEVVANDGTTNVFDVEAKSEQAALRKAMSWAQKQHVDGATASIVDNTQELNEADTGLASKLANWAKNLTNRVTADKLMKAWEKAGSPTDSDEIAKILADNGIDHAIVDDYLSSAGITTAPKADEEAKVMFNTGDPVFDEQLTKLLKDNGKEAVIQALQSYKKKLTAQADPYEKFKGEIRKLAGIKGKKRIPADKALKFKAEIDSDMAKMAKGDKDSGAYAANKIIQYAKAGYDVNNEMTKWLGLAKVGERTLPESINDIGFLGSVDYRDLTAILKEHGFDWKDIGLRIRIDETIKHGVFVSRTVI